MGDNFSTVCAGNISQKAPSTGHFFPVARARVLTNDSKKSHDDD